MLRLCLRSRLRQFLHELPKSLDETYEQVLKEIHETNRCHVHRLLQCLTVAIRPFYVYELAYILASDPDATEGEIPKFDADWRSTVEQDLLSACPSLITIVNKDYMRVVQFSHFSVKEFLTSDRLATSSEDISRYHILPDAAHTTLSLASLGSLLRLDGRYETSDPRNNPFLGYAVIHWVSHVQNANMSSRILRMTETFFDPDKPHFSASLKMHRIDGPSPGVCNPLPLYYSALCGFYELVEHLLKKRPRDVNALGGHHEYPLVAALHGGHLRIAELLFQHGANVNARGSYEQTPLFTAITWPNNLVAGAVGFLLNHGADVNAPQKSLCSPLHLAASGRNFEVSLALLQRRAEVNARCSNGETPLHLVSKYSGRMGKDSCANLAELLLDYGAEVNSRCEIGATPLHNASRMLDFNAARILLDHGAHVNAEDNQRRTPLHRMLEPKCYFKKVRFDVAQLLVEHGADVNARDEYHETPLHLASFHLDLELVQALLDHGASANAENNRGQSALDRALESKHFSDDEFSVSATEVLLERGADVNTRDKDQKTLLHLASSRRDSWVVLLLLNHGADLNAKDNKGKSPLHRAVERKFYLDENCFDVAQLLVEHGAYVNVRHKDHEALLHWASSRRNLQSLEALHDRGADVNAENNRGQALFDGVFKGGYNPEEFIIARDLLDRGADVNARDKDHDTPLLLASHSLYPKSVQVLLDHGADIHARGNRGQTPLHLVIKSGYYSDEFGFGIAQLLLERGMDVNVQDKDLETPLHLASYHLRLKLVRLLFDHGANINAENSRGRTPLHRVLEDEYYSDEGGFGIVQLLVELGADVNIRDKDQQTPLHLASRLMSLEAVWILLQYSADRNAENLKRKIPFQLARESIREAMEQLPSDNCAGRSRRAKCVALMGLLYGY